MHMEKNTEKNSKIYPLNRAFIFSRSSSWSLYNFYLLSFANNWITFHGFFSIAEHRSSAFEFVNLKKLLPDLTMEKKIRGIFVMTGRAVFCRIRQTIWVASLLRSISLYQYRLSESLNFSLENIACWYRDWVF